MSPRPPAPARFAAPVFRAARRGFSAVEVVVAMGLFVLFAGLIGQAVVDVLHATNRQADDGELEQDLRFVVREVLQVQTREEIERGDFIETLGHGRVDWRGELEPTEIVDLHELRIFITFSDPDIEPREREEIVFALRPDWSDPRDRSDLLQRKRETLDASRAFDGL